MIDNQKRMDLVILWVDGTDLTLQSKRLKYQKNTLNISDAVKTTRFASSNEIYYNIASILKYVPFYRYIYIVTDDQTPSLIHEFADQKLCKPDTIRIIDHKTLFKGYEHYLPTFNSLSIEAMLWNIPDLTDYFISLNDDFFFNQTVSVENFLVEEDVVKSVIRGNWRRKNLLKTKLNYRLFMESLAKTLVQPKYTVAQMLGAELGQQSRQNRFFEVHHYPHILDKNRFTNFVDDHPDELNAQLSYRFRNIRQYDPVSLVNHIKIANNEAILTNQLSLNYLKDERGIDLFLANLNNPNMKFGCVQSLDNFQVINKDKVVDAFTKKFKNFLPNSLT